MNEISPQISDETFLNAASRKSKALWNTVRLGLAAAFISVPVTVVGIFEDNGNTFNTLEKVGLGGIAGGIAVAASAMVAYIPASRRDYQAIAAPENPGMPEAN